MSNYLEIESSDEGEKSVEECQTSNEAGRSTDILGDNGNVLTSEVVAAALSDLGHTPDGFLVYTKLLLPSLQLVDISIIGQRFLNIQTLNLDRNNLTSLKALQSMKNLIILSACHNQLTSEGVFSALSGSLLTKTVTKLSLHHNKIQSLTDLRQFHYCREIDLSDNIIDGSITHTDLSNLPSLTNLNLANNMIEEVDDWAFENSGVKDINMSRNKLTTAKFLVMLVPTLRSVNLSNNNFTSFSSLSMLHNAAFIDLSYNNVYELSEVSYLVNCPLLRSLTLIGNPAFTAKETAGKDTCAKNLISSESYGSAVSIAELVAGGVHLLNPEHEDDDIVAADEVEQHLQKEYINSPGNKGINNTFNVMEDPLTAQGLNKSGTKDKESYKKTMTGRGVVIGSPFIEGVNEINQIGQSYYNVTQTGMTHQWSKRQLVGNTAPQEDGDPNYTVLKEKKPLSVASVVNNNTLEGTHPALLYSSTPEEEDYNEMRNLSFKQQIRIEILWRVPSLTILDGERVTPNEMTLAQCLVGGLDRKQREEIWTDAFGALENSGGNYKDQNRYKGSYSMHNGYCAGGSGMFAVQSLRGQLNGGS